MLNFLSAVKSRDYDKDRDGDVAVPLEEAPRHPINLVKGHAIRSGDLGLAEYGRSARDNDKDASFVPPEENDDHEIFTLDILKEEVARDIGASGINSTYDRTFSIGRVNAI